IKWVRGTNFCDISIESNGQTAIVMAAIDNLLKGGAAQALQCFNIIQGFEEAAGLKSFGLNP
ncbi:MAG: N-acetyl-gamma-glutamyl-phosphate reductase, partial [Acidobacteriota bacterium]